MFFFGDFHEFCLHPDLNLRLAKKFVKKARNYKIVMYILKFGFMVAFFKIIIRCVVVSYTSIPLVYFLLITCPMALINLLGYFWLISSYLVILLMAVLSTELLNLRVTYVSKKLKKKFSRNQVVQYDGQENRFQMLKPGKDHDQIIRSIEDIVKQFSVSSIVVYVH